MDDQIYRQAAIDELLMRMRPIFATNQDIIESDAMIFVRNTLESLPSAQPEIIYCKKCKHWTETCGDKQWGLGDCDLFDKHLLMCNGYCAWAERREDG